MKRFVCAITGASGVIYGKRLLEVISSHNYEIFLTVSESALKVMNHELMIDFDLRNEGEVMGGLLGEEKENVTYFHYQDVAAPIASGSFKTNGMVIVPCSMGTLGRIASGISSNLIERAADVMLKERRPLVVVPRETPYSAIHLRNMLELTDAGAIVLPASPGFYSQNESIQDIVDFVVSRALDHIGIPNNLMSRYGEKNERYRATID